MSFTPKKQTGFTIVELLIVIVVIAILAAISVVAFTGIQDRANDSTVEADIANIIKKMELAKVDLGHYPQNLSEFPDFKLSKQAYDTSVNNVYYCIDIANDRYALGLRSKSRKGYILNTGTVSAGVVVHGNATCNVHGGMTWGTVEGVKFSTQGWFADTTPPRWSTSWNWVN